MDPSACDSVTHFAVQAHALCSPAACIDGAEFVMHTHIQIKALQVEQSIVFFPVYRAVLEKGQVFLQHLVDVIDVLLQ